MVRLESYSPKILFINFNSMEIKIIFLITIINNNNNTISKFML